MKKYSPGNWVRVSEGHLWHLEGTSNSFWGKKNSCFRYFKHKAYLGLSKNAGVRTGSKDAPLSNPVVR